MIAADLGAIGVEDPFDARRTAAQIRVGLADLAHVILDFPLHMAAESELILFVRKILHVDDDLAAPRHGGGMLTRLHLRDVALIGQIHERMILDRIAHPPPVETVDAVEHLASALRGIDLPAPQPPVLRELGMAAAALERE